MSGPGASKTSAAQRSASPNIDCSLMLLLSSLRAFLPPLPCCLTCRARMPAGGALTFLMHKAARCMQAMRGGANGLPACPRAWPQYVAGLPPAVEAPHAKPAHQWRNDSPLLLGNKKAVS